MDEVEKAIKLIQENKNLSYEEKLAFRCAIKITDDNIAMKIMAKAFIRECALRQMHSKNKVDCETAEWNAGKCLGYGRSEHDDEPCDECKQCPKQSSYEVEPPKEET